MEKKKDNESWTPQIRETNLMLVENQAPGKQQGKIDFTGMGYNSGLLGMWNVAQPNSILN